MNRNHLKIAWRLLRKNKIHTLINIIGLGIGFSASILMLIYVHHQLSFDRFHENADRIHRFVIEGSMADGKTITGAMTHGNVGRMVADVVPEMQYYSRYYSWGTHEVMIDEQRFTDDRIAWVDSVFFDIFSFPLVNGNPQTALQKPHSAVLTRSIAQKYFGDNDPVGQSLRIENRDYLITAIMEDLPANSHLQFDVLASFHTLETSEHNVVNQQGISFPTYVMMAEGANEEDFKQKTIEAANAYTEELFSPHGISIDHRLQALSRVYLYSDLGFDGWGPRGDIRNVYIFSFLAIIVILIAVFNFINLVTAQSEKRVKEIGMRKVMGAFRKDLIGQFIGESLVITFLAFLFSMVLNEVFIKSFSNLLDENLVLTYWHNPLMLLGVLGLVLFVGVVAGAYPAFYLSHYKPASVLKGGVLKSGGGTHSLRKVLVVFQFAISVFLVISVLLLNCQVQYMKSKDPGFARENVIAVRQITPSIRNAYTSLKADLLQNPGITHVTASQSIPGQTRSLQNSYRQGDDPSAAVMMYENRIQHGYLDTYGITIVEGRNFDPEMRTDTASFILNQAAVRKLGLENPVGEQIYVWNQAGTVIGVVKDYNFLSLHNEIDPMAFSMYSGWFNTISVRVRPGTTAETLSHIREVFIAADPHYVLDYTFVDDVFAQMYLKEEKVNALISYAAILAIVISFMGLYALTSFTVRKKVKEIGIRKTLGATVPQILALLFRDLSRWIITGNLIAWPVAFYVVMRWQESFAFRIRITDYWYLFVFAGLLAATVGFIATLVQSLSAANANPVHSLKSE